MKDYIRLKRLKNGLQAGIIQNIAQFVAGELRGQIQHLKQSGLGIRRQGIAAHLRPLHKEPLCKPRALKTGVACN